MKNKECVVCYDDIEEDDEVIKMPDGGVAHLDCVDVLTEEEQALDDLRMGRVTPLVIPGVKGGE